MDDKNATGAVPGDINEEYYQISAEIMASFPRYRPPVDLFVFREDIAVLAPYSRKGTRLSNEQVEEVTELCASGNLFVSRSDHHIYSRHIVRQLDLVLQDHNLKEAEIANICIHALYLRYAEFYEQPVKAVFDPLYRDVMVVTEYLAKDPQRINAFMRRLFRRYEPAKHAVNTMIVGLWLWLRNAGDFQRKNLDRMALALLVHDIGMSKVPPFILTKKGSLKPEEREKILPHSLLSVKIMQKMEVVFDDLLQICFEHHERLDGSGYPQRIKGGQIPATAALAAVADSFAAMITERSYAPAKEPKVAAQELAADQRYHVSVARLLLAAFANDALGTPHDMDAFVEQKD
ncbi:HD domain-containing phosphohydrolase [uncultured Desulfovibrio sp.]|uniref:HD-GYP domain-containing protein n=1 Tax=uncultured Desulfovibrio sp. TaxID=167968 RepID=UPI00260298AB|nr:HD domain-containing phosphohydrolase [uncultured Desulfovibrio sp.]